MKGLKTLLTAIYPAIILLLLLNMLDCSGPEVLPEDPPAPEVAIPVDSVVAPVDTIVPVDTVALLPEPVPVPEPEPEPEPAPAPPPPPPPAPEPTPRADDELVRRADAVGGSGNLKVTLLWDFEGDIDLRVLQPNDVEIYYNKKNDSSTGAVLDTDNVNGGIGAAENIFWESPIVGKYRVSLLYFQSSRVTGRADSGICTVVVQTPEGEPQQYKVEMNRVNETKRVVDINFE